jgi:hypothetical protein
VKTERKGQIYKVIEKKILESKKVNLDDMILGAKINRMHI